MEIDERILAETTKYFWDFECLKKEDCFCLNQKKASLAAGTILFTDCGSNPLPSCNYCLSLGYSIICHCPTRMEIFKK